jgi:hypothetical protein
MAFSSERVNSGSGCVVVVVVGATVVVVVGVFVVVVTGAFVVVGDSVVVGASVVEVSVWAGASVVAVVVGAPQATSPSTNAIDRMNILFISHDRYDHGIP